MSGQAGVKFYDGYTVQPGREVTAAKAQGLARYARAFFRGRGILEKVELYEGGKLFRVDYHDGQDDAAIRASHKQTLAYRTVGFTIRRTLARPSGFAWERVHSYTASGGLKRYVLVLKDEKDLGWMEIKKDKSGRVTGVTKYHWEDQEELRYVFEYDPQGRLFNIHDLLYGQDVSFEPLKPALAESRFFESGFNLPRALSNTAIPQ